MKRYIRLKLKCMKVDEVYRLNLYTVHCAAGQAYHARIRALTGCCKLVSGRLEGVGLNGETLAAMAPGQPRLIKWGGRKALASENDGRKATFGLLALLAIKSVVNLQHWE